MLNLLTDVYPALSGVIFCPKSVLFLKTTCFIVNLRFGLEIKLCVVPFGLKTLFSCTVLIETSFPRTLWT